MAFTDTTAMAALIQSAYDRYIEFSLRAAVTFRNLADRRPVQQSMPGSSVVFNIYPEMAAVSAPLTETVDPPAVAIGNTSQVTVTLQEWGNTVQATRKLRLFSFSNVDPAIADLVAWNMNDSLDIQVRNILDAGTNVTRSISGTQTFNGGTTATVTSTDIFKSQHARSATTQLRKRFSLPREQELYVGYIHPDCSYDLRSEVPTSIAGWRGPHEYSAAGNIWNGAIGSYEGVMWIESPRVRNAQDGAGSSTKATVYRNLVFGKQALAEAVAEEPGIRFGPTIDSLMRFSSVGWYGVLGWNRYREQSIQRIEVSSSLAPPQV